MRKEHDFFMLGNEKGFALISVYMVTLAITIIVGAAFGKAFWEMRQVEREIARQQSFSAAEAALQSALAQINQNAYTGFINTAPINEAFAPNFQDVRGNVIGSFSAAIQYPNQADWVVITARGSVDTETRALEGRVFLESNFSKYLVYANTPDFSSGDNAQYNDPVQGYPRFVSPNEKDRGALYFTGDWTLSGVNVKLYGDANAQGNISGNNTSHVYGDVYTGAFATDASGRVTNSGVVGGVDIGDGFPADDIDRNRNGSIDGADYPDYHALTATGAGDSHARETQVQIDNNFYQNHNNVPDFSGGTSRDRYLLFSANGASTKITEYTSPAFTTAGSSYILPSSAVVYVKGNAYVKGEIQGRVSVVSSADIYFSGDVKYTGGQLRGDPDHAAAFFSTGKIYVLPNANTSLSGILYAQNNGSTTTTALDGSYVYNPARNRLEAVSGKPYSLWIYGNRVLNGQPGFSTYSNARYYEADPNLKYYRPPGIPVVADLRLVREINAQ